MNPVQRQPNEASRSRISSPSVTSYGCFAGNTQFSMEGKFNLTVMGTFGLTLISSSISFI